MRGTRGRMVYSEGARLRVQALQAAGWTQRSVAFAAGLSSRTVCTMMERDQCQEVTAAAISAAYDELKDVDPRSMGGQFTDRSVKLALSVARRAGFGPLPPGTPVSVPVRAHAVAGPCGKCGGERGTYRRAGRGHKPYYRCLSCERERARGRVDESAAKRKATELLEDYDHLRGFGMNDMRIAQALAMKPDTLMQALRRAGRPTDSLVFDERQVPRAA